MKTTHLKLFVLILVGTLILACNKKTSNPSTPQSGSTPPPDYSGTYINPNSNSDYIKLSNTTNDHSGNKRYHVDFFLYNHCSSCNSGMGLNQDTVLESALLNAPGWHIQHTNSNHPNYPDDGYVLYTGNNTIKLDLTDGLTYTVTHTTYIKQ